MPAVIVDSSWIDIEAGLAKSSICRMPPAFCAVAGSPGVHPISSPPIAANRCSFPFMLRLPVTGSLAGSSPSFRRPYRLLVEPDVFHSPAVVDAVGHLGVALDPGLPAARTSRVDQHRSEHRLRELALGPPDDRFALLRVSFHRLPVDERVEFRMTVAGVVTRRVVIKILIEHLVRVVDAALHR